MTNASLALVVAAEICRFQALDAENPFRRWFGSQEVTCVAAGSPIEFPAGLWNVFARADGAVSAAPMLIDGDAEPAPIAPELGPAATVSALLPVGHAGVVYAPRRGSAFPAETGRVTVPADEPLWLFVLDKDRPVAVIPIAPLAPKTERTVDGRSGGPSSVIGWLRVPEPDRTALVQATGVIAPAVRAGSREADALPPLSLLHGAFVRIADVASGSAELRLDGRGWIPDRRMVKVQPGVTVAPAPLLARATGTLLVHWNTDQDLAALDRSIGACEESEEVPQLVIVISKCVVRARGRFEDEECTAIREQAAGVFFGSATFDDIVPGLYRVEMRFGKLPPSSNSATVGPLRVTDLRVFGAYFTTYGSVTQGGEPLGEKVKIAFPGGIGFAPANTEEYRAVFEPGVTGPDLPIHVETCDGSPRAVVISDEPIRPRTRFNIDIPVNELDVQVTDTFTREPLAGANVRLEVMSRRRPRVVHTNTRTTGEEGSVVWTGVPVRELHLTASLAGYETRKVEPFTMPKSGTHAVDVQLVPLRGTRGRIVSERAFESAAVVWYSPTGSETERADLAADGTFVYTNWHTPEETMAVVSLSHPLWVLRAPASERRQSLTVRFPDAPVAAFDVWLAATVPSNETRETGIVIGGIRVPQPVLAQHQTLRRDPPLLRGSGPQHVRDLLATGPIDVLLGADAKQRVEPGMTDVVFKEK